MHQRLLAAAVAAALAATLAGCDRSERSLDAAWAAHVAGDAGRATTLLEEHLATLDPASDEYREASVAFCEVLAVAEPERAKEVLVQLGERFPDAIRAKDYAYVTSHLQRNSHLVTAVEVIDAGLRRWKDDPGLVERLALLKAEIESANDPAAKSKMKSLGYM